MLPSKRQISEVCCLFTSLKVTYEANYDCDNQISKKRDCCEKITTKTRKIKPLKIPCRLSNSQSDAIVPYTHQTLQTIDSNPNNYNSQQCNNTLYNVPVNIEKSTQACSSRLGTTSDNTTIVVEDSRATESEGPAQHQELLTGCNYDALYDIREMLSRKVDNEVDKFRSSLSSAISEEFDWIAQQQQQLHGGQNNDIIDNSNLSKGAQCTSQETMLVPNEELLLDKHDNGFTYNELEFHEPSTDDCLISDSCESEQHQMDHYVMRLLTASLIINNSLKNKFNE